MCTLLGMKKILVTAIFMLAAAVFVDDSLVFALVGQVRSQTLLMGRSTKERHRAGRLDQLI